MFYQIYVLHLLDGSVIELAEEYDLPPQKGFIAKFRASEPNKIFEIGDRLTGIAYVPKSSIVFISTGGVRKVGDN